MTKYEALRLALWSLIEDAEICADKRLEALEALAGELAYYKRLQPVAEEKEDGESA